MKRPQYEGYSDSPTIPLKEKFGDIQIFERNAQSLLTKASGFISCYDFTLNPYRGCQYGCSYCYAAAFSPNKKMQQDWGNWVVFKQNAVELLEKELARWDKKNPEKPPSIYMSSVTDPYQPFESKQQLTRQLLQVMIPYQPILVIQTRSPIITRDIDILSQFQCLRINMSVPTGSESVRRDFEPRSPSSKARLKAIGTLKHSLPFNEDHDVRFSITITPLLPTLPDDEYDFFSRLEVVDRIVIQEFHASQNRSLMASTREEAVKLKQKYGWWYDEEVVNYNKFKEKLLSLPSGVEILEGQAGFGYEYPNATVA